MSGASRLSDPHHQPAGRALEVSVGFVCAACGAGLALLGGAAFYLVLSGARPLPKASLLLPLLVIWAIAALLLVFAWRLVLNRARGRDGGLLSPLGLRAGGVIFLAGPVCAVFLAPLHLLHASMSLAAAAACFALARQRERHLSGAAPAEAGAAPSSGGAFDSGALAKARLPLATLFPVLPRAMLVMLLLTAGLLAWRGTPPERAAAVGALAAAGGGFVMLVLCVLCALTCPVTVSTEGISSHDPFGSWKRDFLRWESMSAVASIRVLGVRYLRVESTDGGRLWIPTAALSVPPLRGAIATLAPSASPLRQALFGIDA